MVYVLYVWQFISAFSFGVLCILLYQYKRGGLRFLKSKSDEVNYEGLLKAYMLHTELNGPAIKNGQPPKVEVYISASQASELARLMREVRSRIQAEPQHPRSTVMRYH
jgi:hypothetical protein